MAAAAPVFFHDDLPVDPLLQFRNVRDDSDQTVAFREARERLHRLFQGFLVQRAEALVHEHGVELDAARRGLDFIGEPERQGERRLEGFPAGEGLHAALRAVVVIDHAELQAALRPKVIRDVPPLQLILSARHDEESCVRPGDHPVKEARLDIGLQHDSLLARDGSVGRVGERLQPGEFIFQLFELRSLFQDAAPGSAIGVQPQKEIGVQPAQLLLLFGEPLALFPQRLSVRFLCRRQLFCQLSDTSFQRRADRLSPALRFLGPGQGLPDPLLRPLQPREFPVCLLFAWEGQFLFRLLQELVPLSDLRLTGRNSLPAALHALLQALLLFLCLGDQLLKFRFALELLFFRGNGRTQLRIALPKGFSLAFRCFPDLFRGEFRPEFCRLPVQFLSGRPLLSEQAACFAADLFRSSAAPVRFHLCLF